MKTKSAKAKGRRLQNHVVGKIISYFPELKGNIKPAIMGEGGVDIKLSPIAKKVFPFSIECKNQEKWMIKKWWEQAKNNTEDNTKPVLIVKSNNYEPFVIITLDDWLGLISGVGKNNKKEKTR